MRYVVFQFVDLSPSPDEAREMIEGVLLEQLGRIQVAKHGVSFLSKQYDEKTATGLVRAENPELVRAALLFLDSAINIKGVSGTIKGTKRFR